MHRYLVAMAATASLVGFTQFSQAQLYQGSENYAAVTSLNQNTANVGNFAPWNTLADPNNNANTYYQSYGGSNFCAPTSVIMGMEYLKATYGLNWYNTANAYSSINSIGNATYMSTNPRSGTSGGNIVAGTQAWLAAQPNASQFASSGSPNSNTMASFLSTKLDGQWAVQAGILWDGATANKGGHFLSITGIDFDADGGGGTIDFIDPWDGSTQEGDLTVAGNYLRLTYQQPNGGAAGANDPDPGEAGDTDEYEGPGGSKFGDIALAVAEVPEPGAAGIGAVVVMAFVIQRRRRLA